jgi:hypothetical protein
MKIIYENSQIKQTMCWQWRDISNCTEYLIFCIYIFLSYNQSNLEFYCHADDSFIKSLHFQCWFLSRFKKIIIEVNVTLWTPLFIMCICFYSGLSCDVRDCLCVLCIICLFNKCKKWQQTCFCC